MSETTPAAPAATEQTAPAASAETTPSVTELNAPQGSLQGPDGVPGEPEAATTGEAEEQKSSNKVPARERIEQLARERRELAEAKRLADQENESLRARLRAFEQPQQQTAILDPLNFSSDAEYQAALMREAARTAATEIRKEFISERQTQAEARAANAEARAAAARDEIWSERASAFRDKAPDFETVAFSHAHKVSPVMAELIKESEVGPEIAYWLGKNPTEAAKIADATFLHEGSSIHDVIAAKQRAALEIGRLEARFAQPAAPRFTQAPAPVKTVSSGNAAPTKSLNEMSYAEYKAARQAENDRKGK